MNGILDTAIGNVPTWDKCTKISESGYVERAKYPTFQRRLKRHLDADELSDYYSNRD